MIVQATYMQSHHLPTKKRRKFHINMQNKIYEGHEATSHRFIAVEVSYHKLHYIYKSHKKKANIHSSDLLKAEMCQWNKQTNLGIAREERSFGKVKWFTRMCFFFIIRHSRLFSVWTIKFTSWWKWRFLCAPFLTLFLASDPIPPEIFLRAKLTNSSLWNLTRRPMVQHSNDYNKMKLWVV